MLQSLPFDPNSSKVSDNDERLRVFGCASPLEVIKRNRVGQTGGAPHGYDEKINPGRTQEHERSPQEQDSRQERSADTQEDRSEAWPSGRPYRHGNTRRGTQGRRPQSGQFARDQNRQIHRPSGQEGGRRARQTR